MSLVPISALLLAPSPPIPINEVQMRDIGCVATIAILAEQQKAGGGSFYPPMAERGKRWAGIVGARVVDQTGQPRELVALAMQEAARLQAARVEDADTRQDRIADCMNHMNYDLEAADALNKPLPKPVRNR